LLVLPSLTFFWRRWDAWTDARRRKILTRTAAEPSQTHLLSYLNHPTMCDETSGFDTKCLHGGWSGDPTTGAKGVPVYRTVRPPS